ncbi:MAG TPA: carbohydrate kinase [Armatimonadota bacterium]
MMSAVVGLGEILWDVLPGGRRLGGAPANFAYHAGSLGAVGSVVSCVGDDELGRDILDRLGALGLDASCVAIDPGHATGIVDVEVDAAGVPCYTIREDVAWDHMPFTPAVCGAVSKADAICFGTLCQRAPDSRHTVEQALAAARPGALRVLDLNLRPPFTDHAVILSSLERADVVKLNDEELAVLAELLLLPSGEEAGVRSLRERYSLRVVALTRGSRGSLLYDGDISEHPGVAARVVDTVGAGDAFTAALVIGLLRGLSLDVINAAANRLAAHVCAHSGATPLPPDQPVF